MGHTAGRMHEEIIGELEGGDRHLCIELPRGHFKTTLFSEDFPLWKMWKTHDKKLAFGIQTSNMTQSKYILGTVMDAIESIPTLYETLYPDNLQHWSAGYIKTKNGHEMMAQPFGRKGLHYDYLMSDDLQQEAATASAALSIEDIKTVFWQASYSMINARGGKHLVIGTRITNNDLYSEFEEKPKWRHVKYPAVITDPDGKWLAPQFPEFPRYSTLELLGAIRDDMPPWSWQSEYMLDPIGSGTSVFPKELIKQSMTLKYPDNYGEMEKKWCKYYLGHDVALSEKRGSDFFAMVVLKRALNCPLRVVKKVKGKADEETQFEIIRKLNEDYHFSKYVIEQKGLSYAMAEKAAKDFTLASSCEKFNTNHANKDKLIGDVRLLMENKLLGLDGDQDIALELGSFGLVTVNGLQTFRALSGHDDLVMALGLAVYAAGGYIQSKKQPAGFYAVAVGAEPSHSEAARRSDPNVIRCECGGTDLMVMGMSEADGVQSRQLRCRACARVWVQ